VKIGHVVDLLPFGTNPSKLGMKSSLGIAGTLGVDLLHIGHNLSHSLGCRRELLLQVRYDTFLGLHVLNHLRHDPDHGGEIIRVSGRESFEVHSG